MKSLLGIFIATTALSTVSVQASVTTQHRANRITRAVSLENVKMESIEKAGRRFVSLSLEGADNTDAVLQRIGEPALPVIRFYVNGNVQVTAGAGEIRPIDSSMGEFVVPALQSAEKTPGAVARFEMSRSAYSANSFSPSAPYTIEEAGSVNGQSRKLVTLFPVTYNPVRGEIFYRNQFTVTESLDSTEAVAAPGDTSELFVFVAGSRFANSPSMMAYSQFKQMLGYRTQVVVYGNEIRTPQALRAKLKEIYRTQGSSLMHILIVGDSGDVPGYDSTHISGTTDHYYRAIDTDDYESDINGPDVGVGRVTARSEEQLAGIFAKFQRYATGRFTNSDWLNKMSFLATDDQYMVAEGTHNYVIDTYTRPMGYTGAFPAANNAGGDQLYAISNRASDSMTVSTMRQGRAIIQYSGHGAETFWAGPTVTQSDVRSFNDANALPFVVGNACITGDFRVDESFAETWIRHPQGAIVYWGSMDSTYWDEDDILERKQYDAFFANYVKQTHAFTSYALSELWRHYGGNERSKYYWETYTIFGDPQMLIRDKAPTAIQIEAPQTIQSGTNQMAVQIKDASTQQPIWGARIGISVGGAIAGFTVSDQNGNAQVNVSNQLPAGSQITLTVYAVNTILTQQTIQVASLTNSLLNLMLP